MFKNKKGVNWSEKHFLFLDIYKKIDSLGGIPVFSFLVFTKSEKTFPRTHRGPAAILKIFFATHRFSLAH